MLTAVSIAVDVAASIVGAQRVGASKKALWGAAIGGLAGVFFGLPGLLLGPFLGAVGGEMADGRSRRDALKVGAGTWVGTIIADLAATAADAMSRCSLSQSSSEPQTRRCVQRKSNGDIQEESRHP